MQVIDVVKELVKLGVTGISLHFDDNSNQFYYDLNTRAKSHLHFYDDFHVEGRYDHWNMIEKDQDIEDILSDLFYEFKGCIHGRDFYNTDWMEVGVKLGLVEKKVETTTTVSYN